MNDKRSSKIIEDLTILFENQVCTSIFKNPSLFLKAILGEYELTAENIDMRIAQLFYTEISTNKRKMIESKILDLVKIEEERHKRLTDLTSKCMSLKSILTQSLLESLILSVDSISRLASINLKTPYFMKLLNGHEHIQKSNNKKKDLYILLGFVSLAARVDCVGQFYDFSSRLKRRIEADSKPDKTPQRKRMKTKRGGRRKYKSNMKKIGKIEKVNNLNNA